jgi:hypothetical protein
VSISCDRTKEIPDSYNVTISNQYFERIDSLLLDNHKFDSLDVGDELVIPNIVYGSHDLELHTYSNLKIQTTLMLVGTNSIVKLLINENGKIVLTD